ncbi:MAG: hypothetical protein IKC07_03420 [Clostridia bacterium]|nr:hypothetical protein [Clostridia bacterium]
MVSPDTVKLLKECNSGIKMGIDAIEEILPSVKDSHFQEILENSLKEHRKLEDDTREALDKVGDDGKEPHKIAKGMAWFKTNVMMSMEETDKTAADLLTDGCHMGIKSINKYLNQYKDADEDVKGIVKDIIEIEENLAQKIRVYL